MEWNYRKSVVSESGIRLFFMKNGIVISGGVKRFRTGKGLRKNRPSEPIRQLRLFQTRFSSSFQTLDNSPRKKPEDITETKNKYIYSQVVTNEYTGEARAIRARTQYEKQQLVKLEQERQSVNEQRKKQLEAEPEIKRKVEVMNQLLWKSQKELKCLVNLTKTNNCRIDWDKELLKDSFPPFRFDECPPKVDNNYKLSFIRSLFMNDKKFELPDDSIESEEYENRLNKKIAEYVKDKEKYEIEKKKKNGELVYLKTRFEMMDKDAIEKYISIVLTKSEYPVDFEADFEVVYEKVTKKVVINYLFQEIDTFPVIARYEYNNKHDQVFEVEIKKEEAEVFYTEILLSVGVRTIHEVFEAVYTDCVDIVCFNGYIEGPIENQCAFAMKAERDIFEPLDLKCFLGDVISKIESRIIRDFTGYEQITPFN